MPQITVNTGMDTKPIIKGAHELNSAIRSLQSAVGKVGKDLDASVVGYAKAVENNAVATQNFRQRMDELDAAAGKLRSQLIGMAATRVQTPEFKNVLLQIQQCNKELKELEKEEKSLADSNAPALLNKWNKIQKRIADNKEEAEKYMQYIQSLKDEQARIEQMLQNGTDENGKPLDAVQVKSLKKQRNKIQSDLSFEDMMGGSKEYQSYMSAVKQMNEMIARGDDELVKAYQKNNDEIMRVMAQRENLVHTRDDMTARGTDTQLGINSTEYKDAENELDVINAKLARMRELETQFKPPYIQEWERMRTVTGMVEEGFARIGNAVSKVTYAWAHPFEAINRSIPVVLSGIANLAQQALKAAVSFGQMIGQHIISGLQRIGTMALHAATGLAKMASSAIVSFMQRLAISARDAAVQIAKVAGTGAVNGLKSLASMALRAGSALLGIGKSARRSNGGLKQSLKMILRYILGVRSMYMLVRRLRSAVTDAFKNMAKKVPEVNATLSSLASSLDRLKNSLATAFQPVLTAVAPYVTKFMDFLSDVLTKVGMFFAALTGQDYVYKATKANIDYAKSLDKTKKKAKETENQLAKFDDLNILKDTKKDNDDNETPTSDFVKTAVDPAIKSLADKLKQLIKGGEFYQLGEMLANKLNEFLEGIDFGKIGQKIAEWINNIVNLVNGFFDNFDWVALGAKLADGFMRIIEEVDWYELGRALTQKLSAVIQILWGFVNNIDWEEIGVSLYQMLQGMFNNIPWEMLADLVAKLIMGVFTAIYVAAAGFDWVGAGIRIANALRHMIESIDINVIYKALSTLLKGILDFIIPILTDKATWAKIGTDFATFLNNFFKDEELWKRVRLALIGGITSALVALKLFVARFEWGANGQRFGEQLRKLVDDFPDDLGETLSNLLTGALEFMNGAFQDEGLFISIGHKFGTWLFAIFENDELWANLGEFIGLLLTDVIAAFQTFFDDFNPVEAANSIKTGLDKLGAYLPGIATGFWNMVKTAFSKAGSFLDALFSESASLDPEVIKNRNGDSFYGKIFEDERNAVSAFNAQSLGTKIGTKISEALSKIPWESIGKTMWDAAKKAFNGVKDFIVALFGITEDDVSATKSKSEVEAIGIKIGNAISKIPWQEIFETAAGKILEFFAGAWNGLIGQESDSPGNGTVFAILAASFVLLKGGLVKAVAGLTGAVVGAVGANLPLVLDALLVFYDYSKIKEAADGYAEAGEAYNRTVETYANGYISVLQSSGKEAADEYAAMVGQIDTTSMSVDQAIQALTNKAKADWGDAPKDWKEGLSQGWNTYFGEGGSGIVGLVNDGVNGLLETLGLRKPEVTDAMTETYTIPFAPLSEQTNQDTANLGMGGADSLISALDSKKEEVAQKYDETYLPSPEELVEWGYLDAQMVADSGIDGTVDELTTRKGEVEKAYDDTFVKTYESKVEGEGFNVNGGPKSRLATLGAKNAKGYAFGLDSENGTIKKSHDKILKTSETGWGNVEKDQAEKLVAMDKKTSEMMGSMTTTSETETASQAKPVYDNYGEIMVAVDECMRAARDYLVQYAGEMTTAMSDEMNVMGGINWTPVGGNIISGIAQGIYNGWSWLTDTVWNLAQSLFNAAKAALGIHSPSRVFREGVGANIGLGIAEGILDSEPDVLDSVTDLADASANALSDATLEGNYGVGEIGLVDGLDGVLGNFADRVQSSFSNLLSSLNAIAENVAFRTPTIATGAVLPYGVTGQSGGSKPISDIITETNDDQTMAVIQAFNQQTIAIVQAIERYSTTNINIDKKSLTDSIIEEINRRTRAQGKSALLI